MKETVSTSNTYSFASQTIQPPYESPAIARNAIPSFNSSYASASNANSNISTFSMWNNNSDSNNTNDVDVKNDSLAILRARLERLKAAQQSMNTH